MNTYKYAYLITPDNYFNQGQLIFDIEKRLAGTDFKVSWDPERLPFKLMTNIEPLKFHELLADFPYKIIFNLIGEQGTVSSESEKPEPKPCLGPLRKYKIQSSSIDTIDVLLKVLREKFGYFSIDNQGAGAPLAKTEFFMEVKPFVEINIDLSYADIFKTIEHDMAKIEGYELRFIGSLFNWRDINCHFENGQTLRLEPLYADPGLPFIEMPSYEELKLKALKKPSSSITFQTGQVLHLANDPNAKSLSTNHFWPDMYQEEKIRMIQDNQKYFQDFQLEPLPSLADYDPSAMSTLVESLMNEINKQEQEILKKVITTYTGHEFSNEQDLPKIECRHIQNNPNKTSILYDGKLLGYIHRDMTKSLQDPANPFITQKIYFTPFE